MSDDRSDLVPALEAYTVESGLRLWWFGGPSYALKSPQTIVYVDPFHSGPRADDPQGFIRAIPNYFFPQTVRRAELILSTHDHIDHCDPDTLKPMYAQTKARLAVAPSSAEMIAGWGFDPGRVTAMPPGATLQLDDVTLTAYPSQDWEDTGAVTFVLAAGGATVFIGGDTMYLDALEQIGRQHSIDLAVLALGRNRRDIIDAKLYADPAEVAQAALALRARRLLPIHWEIWREWQEDPQAIAPHLAGSGTELVVLGQGETLDIGGAKQ